MYQCPATLATMPSTRLVPDYVWHSLDPHAGHLSRRERYAVIAFVAVFVLVLAAGIWAGTTGRIFSRLDATMTEATPQETTHDVAVEVEVYAQQSAPVRVSGMSVDSASFSIISTQPAVLTVPGGGRGRILHLVVHVRSCAAVDRHTVMPIAAVTEHWWGHQSRILFSESGNRGITRAAWAACHNG